MVKDILIYATDITSRLQYACHILFSPWKISWKCTRDAAWFESYSGIKINYSDRVFYSESILIHPVQLLFERGILPQKTELHTWEDLPCFFATGDGSLPFDLFAATFFLVSRYEEYLPVEKDNMGRFDAQHSVSSRLNLLQRPIIDQWRLKLRHKILNYWPQYALDRGEFSALSTIDVDSAFAYTHKGIFRTAGGCAQDVLKGRWENLFQRTKTLIGCQPDPYDTFDFILDASHQKNVAVLFFFLLADFSRYDKNVPHHSPRLQQQIRKLVQVAQVGIHPGVGSHQRPSILKKEIQRLADITGEKVSKSRMHYLKFSLPETYRRLAEFGITDDYSMGYASDTGFRAGTSLPFLWYDVEKEATTELTIHPFACMDATLKNYLRFSPAEASQRIGQLIDTIKTVNGTFISLWHNESLSETKEWLGFRSVYLEMLDHYKPMLPSSATRW